MFNWHSDLTQIEKDDLFSFVNKYQINTLYQGYDSEMSLDEIDDYLYVAEQKKVDIYYTLGKPDYVMNDEIFHELDLLISKLKKCEYKKPVKGIVLDIEPYLLDEWDENKVEMMNQYVRLMQDVYQITQKNNLELIICIPYYYDNWGFSESLDLLVKDACDGIAIMNYYRKNEAKHIEYEVSLCEKYEKQIINIYEFKKPGEHSLESINTYYELGIKEAEESFIDLQNKLDNSDINLALHDYDALKEIDKDE